MQQSGVAVRQNVDLDFEDDQDSKVHVLIHDLKPPFLDGTVAYTKQLEPINPVRDVTSDLAVFSKKGSALVRERRERQEREKVGHSYYRIVYANRGRPLPKPPLWLGPRWETSWASRTSRISERVGHMMFKQCLTNAADTTQLQKGKKTTEGRITSKIRSSPRTC